MTKPIRSQYHLLFWICGWNSAIFSYCVVCFTPMFLVSTHFYALSTLSHAARITLLGCILAIKPLVELIASYPVAKITDTTNIKRLLQISIICGVVSLLGFIIAYTYNWLSLMFLSQVLLGLSSLNIIPIKLLCCHSNQASNRTKHFNFVELSAGLGMLIGPILGGLLAGFFFNTFLPQIPFFLALIMGVSLLLLTQRGQLPSAINPVAVSDTSSKKLTTYPINMYLFAWFLFMLGWQGYFHWFPALMVKRFNLSHHDLTRLFMFMGIIYAAVQMFIIKPLTKLRKQKVILYISLPAVAITISSFALAHQLSDIYILLCIYMIAVGLLLPFWQSIISFCGAKKSELFGSITLLTGLSSLIVTSLGSVLAAWSIGATFLLWGGLIMLSFITMLAAAKKNQISNKEAVITGEP